MQVLEDRLGAIEEALVALSLLTLDSIYLDEFANVSDEKRKELADKGWALKDGSFPIENVGFLHRAINAFGRAVAAGKARAVAQLIMKRARDLGRLADVPDSIVQRAS